MRIILSCLLGLLLSANAAFADDSRGYRYRVSFEVNDDRGQATIHAYTNSWIRLSGPDTATVIAGNPHSDIKQTGHMASIMMTGCVMVVGRGPIYREELGTEYFHTNNDGNLLVAHSTRVYDFIEKAEMRFDKKDCK